MTQDTILEHQEQDILNIIRVIKIDIQDTVNDLLIEYIKVNYNLIYDNSLNREYGNTTMFNLPNRDLYNVYVNICDSSDKLIYKGVNNDK